MLLIVIVAVFVAGLMVGRTPEYLGKKIEAKEVKMSMLTFLILPRRCSPSQPLGCSRSPCPLMAQAGPHGFSEMLYPYTSTTGNNGSAFAGMTANTPCHNTTGGIAMLIGRYFYIVPMMAVAGALATKKIAPPRPVPSRPMAPSSSSSSSASS